MSMKTIKENISHIFDILIILTLIIVLGEIFNSYFEGAMLASGAYISASVIRVVVMPAVSFLIAKSVHYFLCQHVESQHLKKPKKS